MRRATPLLIAFFTFVAPADAAWVWPVSGDVITPYRNGTDPYATGQHRGIDIAAPVGTPVVAASGGDVRFAGTAGSSGLTVSIRTGDAYDTSYLHLSTLAVRAGTHVSTGDRIGAVGTTGVRSATAPHLHFGVRDAGTRHDYRDPLGFLPPPPAGPAPEPPVTAPAPAPAPAPRAPSAAPVTAPRPAPVRAPRAAPTPGIRHRPVGAPRVAPVTTPRAAPTPGIRHRPVLRPRPGFRHQPAFRGAPHPHATPSSHSVPRAVTDPAGEPHPHPSRSADPEGAARGVSAPRSDGTHIRLPGEPERHAGARSHDPGGGRDIGWLAACAGLLLAAAVLGVSADRARSRSSAGGRMTARLRGWAGARG
jgi:hypothetical protein